MSDRRHALVLGLSLTGFGNLPSLTPAHQLERDTGIMAGIGGVALGLPMICGNLKNPCMLSSILSSLCIKKTHEIWPRIAVALMGLVKT